jgi:hypothetical protein
MNQPVVNRGMAWRPAPLQMQRSPYKATREMGQVQNSVAFLDDPLLAVSFDVLATGTSAYLAYGMTKAQSAWAPLWLVLATAMGVKTLHDLSRTRS